MPSNISNLQSYKFFGEIIYPYKNKKKSFLEELYTEITYCYQFISHYNEYYEFGDYIPVELIFEHSSIKKLCNNINQFLKSIEEIIEKKLFNNHWELNIDKKMLKFR